MADIVGGVAVNPDAQAAVTDFLEYTEYLPADLIRSLTLIRGLDDTYLQNSHAVHDLTKTFGSLPGLPVPSRPDATRLRTQISTHLDQALNARESAYAEACRLYDLTDRHQNRLKSIIAKLNALPKPPSRDPSPQPQPQSSAKRSRSGRKLENGMSATRLTLKPPKGPSISLLSRPKHRRITVPGEVLPPFDPDEPIASTEVSDWESDRAPSPVRPILKLKQPKPPKPVSLPVERRPREIVTYRKPTPPPDDAEIGSKFRPWTHLTEYEMYRLRKKMKKNHTWEPSEVMIRRELAEKGRGWENYYKAKADAKANGNKFLDIGDGEKEATREPEQVETPKATPATVLSPVPVVLPVPATPATKPKVVVKKAEPKKERRDEPVLNKAALAAQEAELAARRLGDIGSAFKNLFSPLSNALASLNRSASSPIANSSTNSGKKIAERPAPRKRKVDEAGMSESLSAEPEQQKKKQKIILPPLKPIVQQPATEPTSAVTIKIPIKLNVNSQVSPVSASSASSTATSSASSSSISAPATATNSRSVSVPRTSVAPKVEASSPAPPSRPASRHSITTSIEPVVTSQRPSRAPSTTPAALSSARRTPIADGPVKTVQTAASRRSKRDAPGTVTQSSQDGGAAVSVSQRKARPSKQKPAQTLFLVPTQSQTSSVKSAASASVDSHTTPQIRIDVDGNQEIVDPDEERYCICGDVSWGEMICCEMDEKCEYGQWFHMECISLVELPPRTVKWYCPGDRKKLHHGENSNGLVGRGIK